VKRKTKQNKKKYRRKGKTAAKEWELS